MSILLKVSMAMPLNSPTIFACCLKYLLFPFAIVKLTKKDNGVKNVTTKASIQFSENITINVNITWIDPWYNCLND